MVLPRSTPQEAEIVLARLVLSQHVEEMPFQRHLRRERAGQLELPPGEMFIRNLLEEPVDALGADLFEHPVLGLLGGVGHVRMCSRHSIKPSD